MSLWTFKSYLIAAMRYENPEDNGNQVPRSEDKPLVIMVNGTENIVRSVHSDFIVAEPAYRHGRTMEWTPRVTGMRVLIPLDNISQMAILQ